MVATLVYGLSQHIMSSSTVTVWEQLPANTAYAGRKLFTSLKKAAWIASTSLLILLVPLIIEMDREQQIIEMEKQQMDVLTGPGGSGAPKRP